MKCELPGLSLSFSLYQDGIWREILLQPVKEGLLRADTAAGKIEMEYRKEGAEEYRYVLRFSAPLPSRLRMTLTPTGKLSEPFHLIPACLFGSNNDDLVKPGEFPLLTDRFPGTRFCSPVWEFRADRAAMPISVFTAGDDAWGVSVDPYTETPDGNTVRNGVFSQLPSSFGISLGYTNRPVTFLNKRTEEISTGDSALSAAVSGSIYHISGSGRIGVHRMIRAEYARRRVCPKYRRSLREAADALFDTFTGLNWDPESGEYTNRCCRPRDWLTLRPWRNVTEIGWTGGAIQAVPMLMYEKLTPGFLQQRYRGARSAEDHLNRICACYNPASGLLFDLMVPNAEGNRVNGWWTGYGLVRDCHCAYNSGTAVYSLLYAVDFLKKHGHTAPDLWLDTARKVLETVVSLQREDGAFGYTYALDRHAVLDWDGFAGCWFAAAAALLYRLTGEKSWYFSARKAVDYYGEFVKALNCWGTPMDTWKAVDQEGNIAFMRACSILWQDTKNPDILKHFIRSAEYEYLWRFGYATRPEYPPIREGWSACGGSITSVSNPHIHPMGVLINSDLKLLADITGDDYHLRRAEDGTSWLMQTLELYPDQTGYGQYGLLSERWCPSDGLLTERYADGNMYSSWFSYNLWAAANALQAVCEALDSMKKQD